MPVNPPTFRKDTPDKELERQVRGLLLFLPFYQALSVSINSIT
jgi:hypothetical protein